MKLKDGVSFDGLRDEIRAAFPTIDQVHQDMTGTDATATSTCEGKHSATRSAHYRGDAVDLRTWYVDAAHEFGHALTEALGGDFVVLIEATHIHVHWSPIYHDG